MQRLFKIFFWGLFISFVGSLPLGTLNIAAMQISIKDGITEALQFALGCLLVEMAYVRLSLVGMNWVRKQEKLMKIMDWLTVGIVGALAIGSFIAATHGSAKEHGNIFLQSNMNRVLLGLIMSAINPVQIPFWFGWSTVLFSKKLLEPQSSFYNFYIGGIGIGTLLGNCVFIFGGRWIVEKIQNSEHYLNWIIGGIFTLTALIQVWRILHKKDTFDQLEDKIHHIPEK